MDKEIKNRVSPVFWVVAVIAMLWNLGGMAAFIYQSVDFEGAIASLPEHQLHWMQSMPRWLMFVFGAAVSTAVLGNIGLIMRRKWCLALFAISLLAVLIQMGYSLVIADGLHVLDAGGVAFNVTIIVVAGFLVWYSYALNTRGQLM
ncbi:MAG: hypothetical protein R3C03_11735 [Pirellulaceae bacterium]